jgi:dTDP-4-amino-4,6-dideoxygalactose transaminase
VLVDSNQAGWSVEDLRAALDGADIESRPLWKPMHRQPVFAGARAFLDGSADALFARGLTLPSGSALTAEQIDTVMGALGAFLGERR